MPEDASMDMEKLKEEIMKSIPDYAKVNKTEIAPIAFGLKALMLYITMPDQSPDELMDKIAGIEGVGNATIDELSLIWGIKIYLEDSILHYGNLESFNWRYPWILFSQVEGNLIGRILRDDVENNNNSSNCLFSR